MTRVYAGSGWGFVALALAVLWLVPHPATAQPELNLSHWRFYSSIDGLRESWIEDITEGHHGRHWITHGSVDSMTLFDGYTFRRLPAPGVNLTVREGPDESVWAFHRGSAFAIDGLQIFEDERWTPYLLPGLESLGLPRNAFLPWARDRVLIVARDRLLEFNRATRAVQVWRRGPETPLDTFRALEPRRDGGAWIGGRGHLAILEPGNGSAPPTFHEQPLPAEFRAFEVVQIHDADANGLFVTVEDRDRTCTLMVFRNGKWDVMVRGTVPGVRLEGWAAATETWVLTSSNRTFAIDLTDETGAGRPRTVRQSGALSGAFHVALIDRDGAFWVATSLGLARHAPTLWRPPGRIPRPVPLQTGIRTMGRHVGALYETRRGDIVGAAESAVLWRHDDKWEYVPTPGGITAGDMTDGIGELRDGRLIFNAPPPDGTPALLTFDPEHETFGWFTHPEGRAMELVATAPDGTMWFHTRKDGRSRLERFNGETFTPLYDAGTRWHVVPPRSLIVASNGDIYVLPEQTGVGVLQRDGTYRAIAAAEGYPGAGPFCGIEASPGRYWFGDRDGIIELNNGKWSVLRSQMQTVRSLVRGRDGTIWATSGIGVHAYRQGSWLTVGATEGLPEGGVYDLIQDRAGVIWASTTLGLTSLHAESDTDPPETTIDPSENPREAPPSGDVRLVFGGLDRWQSSPSRRLLFSWRLDGGEWSPFTPDPDASLHGLKAGEHHFEVRAMDRNWNIDPTPATHRFSVLLAWYRETGFIIIALAAAMALGAVVALVASRHRRLGRLVAERTTELAESNRQLRRELEDRQRVEEERGRLEAQLHQAQKLEAIGRLAGGIAHDFNNLLTVIISYGEMLSEDLPEDHALFAPSKEIVAAAQRAATLTRQLLAFGRHQVRKPQALDLNAVVTDIERMLRRLIGEDIDLEFRPGRTLQHVLADRGQIEQVIVNLAVNARDAMPRGGKLTIETANVEIDDTFVRTHVGAEPGDYVVLAVSDTGVGMDAETKERIFEPFFTTKARDKGSGLGLATVYGIIKQAGGHVWVYSEPGKGATFKIYLPCTAAPLAEIDEREDVAEKRGSETVLLVEDDDAVRDLTSTVLRAHGYTVIEAPSAEVAEDIFDQNGHHHVDLVLSDIVLSGISGPQLAERLRKNGLAVRFLFMSGYADDAVIRHGILESEIAFIQKPFTSGALARKVRETLDT